jgi:hypothetical protein
MRIEYCTLRDGRSGETGSRVEKGLNHPRLARLASLARLVPSS